MPATDPTEDFIKGREEQKQVALAQLNIGRRAKITLKRPVFFVPGWTDEMCNCWAKGEWGRMSIKEWIGNVTQNPDKAYYINFIEETMKCKSFLDFGEVLKVKIWDIIGKNAEFDIAGHSMGGLDIRAAVAQGEPLLNINKCLTVATPHQGDNLGGIDIGIRKFFLLGWIVNKVKPETPYQKMQSEGLDPDYEPIQLINEPNNKIAFLERIGKLYELKGSRDFTVKGSAYLDETGIAPELCKSKIEKVEIPGADHTGKIGITQDPRTILAVLRILCDIDLERSKYNYGHIYKRT